MPLQSKVLIFFTVLLLLITFQWLFFITHEEKLLKDEKESQGIVLTRTLAQLSVNPLVSYQITRLEGLVDSIKSERDVVSARVVNSQFLVLADTRRENEGWIYSGKLPEKPELNFTGTVLVVREPIEVINRIYGMAEVVFSLEEMNRKIMHSRITFSVLLLIELLLSILFAIFLEIQVIRPLGEVAAEVEDMTKAEFRDVFNVPRHSSVEIRKVGEALEDMRNKLLENRNEMVSKAKFATMGKIAFNLAHEIRNPLEAISGAVEILGDEIEEGSDKNDYLAIIKDEVENLNEYLSEFLEFTRSQPRNREASALDDLIKDTLLLLNPLIKKNRINIVSRFNSFGVNIFVDTNQFKRVLLNILINSIEALPEGGIIDISTEIKHENNGVTVLVKDNGTGIHKKYMERIFEPYFSTKKNGSGIGLALCKKIIEQHEGSIEIRSVYGRETEVRITLPLLKENQR